MKKTLLPALLTSSILLLWGEPIFATKTKECKLPENDFVTVRDGTAVLRTDPTTQGQNIPGANGKKARILKSDRLYLLRSDNYKPRIFDDTCYLPVILTRSESNEDPNILKHRPYWVSGKAVDPEVKPSSISPSGSSGGTGNNKPNYSLLDQYILWCLVAFVLFYLGFNIYNTLESRKTEDEKKLILELILQGISGVKNQLPNINSNEIFRLINQLDQNNQSLINALISKNQLFINGLNSSSQLLVNAFKEDNHSLFNKFHESISQLSSDKFYEKSQSINKRVEVDRPLNYDEHNSDQTDQQNVGSSSEDQPEIGRQTTLDKDQNMTSNHLGSDTDDQLSRSHVIENFNNKNKGWFQKNIDKGLFEEFAVTAETAKGKTFVEGKPVTQLERRKRGALLIYKQESKYWLIPNITHDTYYRETVACFSGNDDRDLADLGEVVQRGDKWQVVSHGRFKD